MKYEGSKNSHRLSSNWFRKLSDCMWLHRRYHIERKDLPQWFLPHTSIEMVASSALYILKLIGVLFCCRLSFDFFITNDLTYQISLQLVQQKSESWHVLKLKLAWKLKTGLVNDRAIFFYLFESPSESAPK